MSGARGFEVVADAPTEELPAVEAPQDAPPGSVLAKLRAQAARQREDRRLDLPIGGEFGDSLIVRYRLLPMEEWDQYAALFTGAAEANERGELPITALNVRLMVSACETVLFRDDDGAETDLEVGLDGRLWELLGWDLPSGTTAADMTPREVVGALFPSFFAMGAHCGRLVSWMQDPSKGGDLGEA